MKVIVTKDAFGVCIWKPDAKLELRNGFSDMTKGGAAAGEGCWYVKNYLFNRSAKAMPDKLVKRFFPELEKSMYVGELRHARLDLKFIK